MVSFAAFNYLKKYPDAFDEESESVRNWVKHGYSVDDNPWHLIGDDGQPLDCIQAYRKCNTRKLMCMHLNDIAELDQLLKIYEMTYQIESIEVIRFIEDIHAEYLLLRKTDPDSCYSNRNPRGVGRKPYISDDTAELVIQLRESGKTIRQIVEELSLSTGSVHTN